MGTACTISSIVSAAAVTENLPGKFRANSISVVMGFPNCISIMIYSLIAYFVRDWRLLQLILVIPALGYIPLLLSNPPSFVDLQKSVPCVERRPLDNADSFVLPCLLKDVFIELQCLYTLLKECLDSGNKNFFDESPRWLAFHGRHEEAVVLLRRAARLNSATLPPEVHVIKALEAMTKNAGVAEVDVETSQTKVDGLSCMKTFKIFLGSPKMRRISILTPTVWFLHCLFYIGIPLNAHNYGGSPFVYVALTGLADLASPVLALVLGNRWGRVKFLISLSVLSGGSSLFCLALKGHVELVWLFMILAMSLIATAYLINYTYIAELNPTCVRGKGMALCAFVGHSSYILAPYITEVLGTIHNLIPNIVFGMCGLTAGCILPFLPETKDLPLCETVEDVEERSKRTSKKAQKVTEGRPLAESLNVEV
ncbi:organic cation transporter protein-like [Oratosquilla oratoria]|uniref:organic cation transporter protein-like n=1 Tax=Oratosquilla oratoria TaxID=337810 RepID=UPI003F75CA76